MQNYCDKIDSDHSLCIEVRGVFACEDIASNFKVFINFYFFFDNKHLLTPLERASTFFFRMTNLNLLFETI